MGYAQERVIGYDEPFKLFQRDQTRTFEKAPEVYKFLDYSTMGSVNKTTGKFDFTIPFYTYKDKFIELPIGINYSTSGVKMYEYLSTIGVDWSLVAGGSITRHVKGMPDDLGTNEGSSIYQSANAFTGRMYRFPLNSGIIPANYGMFAYTTINTEKYLAFSSQTSVFGHPIFNGSIRKLGTPYYMYHYPKRWWGQYGELAYATDYFDSVKWFFHEHKYNSNRGNNDFERDIFKVSFGDMDFSFMLQEKEVPLPEYTLDPFYSTNGSLSHRDRMQQLYTAVPLDEKGYTIQFFVEDIPLFRKWNKSHTSKSRIISETYNPDTGETYITTGPHSSNPHIALGINKFIITDKEGIKYHFNKYTIADSEYLHSYMDNNVVMGVHTEETGTRLGHKAVQWGLETSSTTEWKISLIVLPNQETISFNYNEVIYNHKTEVSRTHTGEYKGHRYNLMPMWHPLAENDHFVNKRATTYELTSIETPVSIIEFNYDSTDRVDVESGARTNLKEVLIKDKMTFGHPVKRSFTLDKEVITSQYASLNQHLRKRMFLKSVTDSRYEHSYTFDYTTPSLLGPKNEAKYQDLWGYAKHPGTTEHPSFPQFFVAPDNPTGHKIMYTQPANANHFVFEGNLRFIDEGTIKSGTLQRINFPTKGYLEIEYESNTYYDDLALIPNVEGPGLRVSRLNYFDNDNTKKRIKKYTYSIKSNPSQSSGVIMYRPSFAYISNDGYDNDIDMAAMEDIWYHPKDLSNIVSYNSSNGLFKRGVPFASGDNPLITTYDKQIVLKKLIKVSNYPLGPTRDYKGREVLYKEVEESVQSINDETNLINRSRQFNHYEDNRTLVQMSGGTSSEFQYIEPNVPLVPWTIVGNTAFNTWDVFSLSYGLLEIQGYDIYPFPDRDQFGTRGRFNGYIERVENYASDGSVASKSSYEYSLSPLENKTINSIQSAFTHSYVYNNDDSSQKYAIRELVPGSLTWKSNGQYIRNATPTIDEITCGVTFFTVNELEPLLKPLLVKETNIIDGITQIKELEYDDNYLLIKQIESMDSNNAMHKNHLTYAFEVPSENDNQFLIDNGQINRPVKSEYFKSGVLLSRQEFEYKRFGAGFNTQLHKVTSQKGTSQSYENLIIDKYDTFGNLLQFYPPQGLVTSQIWGYNNNYPIIKIEGVSYDEAIASLTTYQLDSIDSGNENGIVSAANGLRTSFPNANVEAYIYDPLVGIKLMIDKRGRKTFYRYDDFDRLEYILDHDQKVLKAFKYGYKDQ